MYQHSLRIVSQDGLREAPYDGCALCAEPRGDGSGEIRIYASAAGTGRMLMGVYRSEEDAYAVMRYLRYTHNNADCRDDGGFAYRDGCFYFPVLTDRKRKEMENLAKAAQMPGDR